MYPLWNENGILSISVEIDRNRLYVLSEGVEERNQKQSSGPRSPSQIFIHQQIASGVTDWKDAWRDIRKMADVKTSITFNDCVYVLHKKNVPHPKSDGMIDAVEFDQETEPPKTITINKYSFRDSFQRLIKKK